MSALKKFIQTIEAHCTKERIYFSWQTTKPEENYIPLLDFYNAFEKIRNKYSLIECIGLLALAERSGRITGLTQLAKEEQKKQENFIPLLQSAIVAFYNIGDKIESSFNDGATDTTFMSKED